MCDSYICFSMFGLEWHTHIDWSKCAFTFHNIFYKNGTWFNISPDWRKWKKPQRRTLIFCEEPTPVIYFCAGALPTALTRMSKTPKILRFFTRLTRNIIRWPMVYYEFLDMSCNKVFCTSPPFTKQGLDGTRWPSSSPAIQSIDSHRLCNVAREQKQARICLGSDRETCQPFHFACSHSAPASDSIRWESHHEIHF